MIEKYYASHIKTNRDAPAINVRKARVAKAKQALQTELEDAANTRHSVGSPFVLGWKWAFRYT